MIVHTNIKFRFDFTTDRNEIQDIILSGDYFRENIIDWEVEFHE